MVPPLNGWTGTATDKESRYAVWTIGPSSALTVTNLNPTPALDAALNEYISTLRDYDHRKNNGRTLRELSKALFSLLLPQWKTLSTAKRLIIIPDGLVNLVPFGALVTPDDHYLIEETNVGYANGLRDLVRYDDLPASRNPPVFVANPAAEAPDKENNLYYLTPWQGEIHDTLNEITGISNLFAALRIPFIVQKQAIEPALKSLSAPSILHIASHGWYLANRDDSNVDNFDIVNQQPNGLSANQSHIANPLLRALLVMAGYNQVHSIEDEDGILTALEIAGLDLRGTDLAVASACFTGQGTLQHGDGVYGIRSAFAVAGAKTQVVSLWSIPDFPTSAFMQRLYSLPLEGLPKSDALSEAQRDFISDEQFSDLLFWGAFTASGQNGSLQLGTPIRIP